MKKENIFKIVGILVLLIGVLFTFGPQLGINIPSLSVINQGFSTLSLSQIAVNSNDPNINGKSWLLTVSQNGAGQSAYGASATLKDDTTKATSDPLTIKVSLDKNYATYPIYNQGIPIYSVTYATTRYDPFSSSGGCNTKYWTHSFQEAFAPFISIVYCFNYNKVGEYGTIGAGRDNFKSTIKVSGKSGSDSCVVSSNEGSSSCHSSKGNLYASWVGSLVSGQELPNAIGQGVIAVYDTKDNGWKTASKTAYTRWNNYQTGGLFNCIGLTGSASTAGSSCFDTYDNYQQALMSGKSFKSYGGSTASTSGSQSSGQINLDLGQQFNFPVITMRIKANFIGINIPTGKPKITYASSPQFQTGQTGNIMVTLKNEGKGVGSFDVFAKCTNGISQSGNTQRISSLSPGQSQTINIPLTSNVLSGTKVGSCLITADDVNDPTLMSTYTVKVSSNAISICTDGKTKFIGSQIQECQNNKWIIKQTCKSTQHPGYETGGIRCIDNSITCAYNQHPKDVNGKLVCVSNGGNGGNGGNWFGNFFRNIFNSIFGNFFATIKWIVVLLSSLLTFVFSRDFLDKVKTIPEVLNWGLSIIFGVLIGLLVFNIIWVAVFIFIGYIVLKIFLEALP